MLGKKSKQIAAKADGKVGTVFAQIAHAKKGKGKYGGAQPVVPAGDQARSGARTFAGPTVAGDALQNRIAQARARAAQNAAPIVQVQARTAARQSIQAFARANPGSAAVRSVPGVNIAPTALSSRVDLLKPQIGFPRLIVQKSLPSPFLQGRG